MCVCVSLRPPAQEEDNAKEDYIDLSSLPLYLSPSLSPSLSLSLSPSARICLGSVLFIFPEDHTHWFTFKSLNRAEPSHPLGSASALPVFAVCNKVDCFYWHCFIGVFLVDCNWWRGPPREYNRIVRRSSARNPQSLPTDMREPSYLPRNQSSINRLLPTRG